MTADVPIKASLSGLREREVKVIVNETNEIRPHSGWKCPPLDPRAEGGHQGRTFQLRRLRSARQSVALAATLAAVKMAYLLNFTKRSRKNWGSPRP